MRIARTAVLVVPAGIALLLAGCAASGTGGPVVPAAAAEADAAAPTDEPTERMEFTGSMALEPSNGPAGTSVTLTGTDLPAGTELEVLWRTADCEWQLAGEQQEEYHGRVCTDRDDLIDTVTTGARGQTSVEFTVPEDYGFAHDVLLRDSDGVIRNKAMFDIDPVVTVTPSSGPVGTPITIEIVGIGRHTLEDTRTILYDNRYVGFMSAVTTQGTARATIPATGSVGPHRIGIARGAYTFPYLNPAQSPRPDIPVFEATFTVTEGEPVLPASLDAQNPGPLRQEAAPVQTGEPAIATDLVSGPVGTKFQVVGRGFEPGDTVTLQWFRIVGNRVGGQGWEERSLDLGEATVDAAGAFVFGTQIPGDVGGPHRIEARVDDVRMAETAVAITPQAQPLSATSVPWGTEVTLHLTGVGWTETANIYTIVYDNAYMGYACGFNTQGDVQVPISITGDPGWHFIDLYPAIYKGQETRGRDNFRIPQLTYADDHPGEDLPAFHFAVFLEE